MKRFPPHDPPEYLEWAADPKIMSVYRDQIRARPETRAAYEQLGREGLGRLYRGMVRSRLYDIALKRWVRTGVLTKAWLGIGEEAATIGAVHALEATDVIGPMIRNQAACFEKGIPLADCFKVYLATGDTITRGRDLHIGDLRCGVVSPISHVGDLVPVLAGFALAFKNRGEARVALTWCGEGATRTGAAHEGLGLAAALRLPLILIVQDNQVALGTRRDERFEAALRALAASHGVRGMECDGNHVLDVYQSVRAARAHCLAGNGPVVLYTRTFRMGGHATHDEAEARRLFDRAEFRYWGARDPIACFEEFLRGESTLGANPSAVLTEWEDAVFAEVEAAAAAALRAKTTAPPEPHLLAGGAVSIVG
ncbi:MAG: thiamine pyrophosphate-dependent dehydrogenase E1 component subunit alpha [Planctomycetota bacterium]